jgi:hypothetical protein
LKINEIESRALTGIDILRLSPKGERAEDEVFL